MQDLIEQIPICYEAMRFYAFTSLSLLITRESESMTVVILFLMFLGRLRRLLMAARDTTGVFVRIT